MSNIRGEPVSVGKVTLNVGQSKNKVVKNKTVEGPSAVFMLIPLYLLLMCFFIILSTISTQDKAKKSAVMKGMDAQFKARSDGSVFPERLLPSRLIMLRKLFTETSSLEGVEPIVDEGGLKIKVASPSFFVGHSTAMRRGQDIFLLKLISQLLESNHRIKMKCIVGIEPNIEQSKAYTMAYKRVAQMARFWVTNGAPLYDFEIGINGKAQGIIEFVFESSAEGDENGAI